MRFVVYGAGAIGGVVGGRMAQHGHDVAFIARGDHGRAIASSGLRLESPEGPITIRLSALADHPSRIDWRPGDVVLLAVKSQDTEIALSALALYADTETPVVCLQNGVANERVALRRFENVYGVTVICPAGYITPGTVVAYSAPIAALLDIGRYPTGQDTTSAEVAEAFNTSAMDSIVRSDVMRWKYAKLLNNLSNAVDALCSPEARGGRLATLIREEGVSVLNAAGIPFASQDEDRERRGNLRVGEVPGHPRFGSSSRQSLARSAGSIESDYLNGEIVLLGRLHGVPTPANELVRGLANRAAAEKWPPGRFSEDEILEQLPSSS